MGIPVSCGNSTQSGRRAKALRSPRRAGSRNQDWRLARFSPYVGDSLMETMAHESGFGNTRAFGRAHNPKSVPARWDRRFPGSAEWIGWRVVRWCYEIVFGESLQRW